MDGEEGRREGGSERGMGAEGRSSLAARGVQDGDPVLKHAYFRKFMSDFIL